MLEFILLYLLLILCYALYERYAFFKIFFPLLIIFICGYIIYMIHWLFTDPGHAIGALLFHIVLGTLLTMAFLIFGGITAYIAGFFYILIKAIKKLFINTKNLF